MCISIPFLLQWLLCNSATIIVTLKDFCVLFFALINNYTCTFLKFDGSLAVQYKAIFTQSGLVSAIEQ